MSPKVWFYTVAVLALAALPGSAGFGQEGIPVLVLADGPEGVEKAAGETALIDGTEWTEAPIVQDGLTIHVLFKDPDKTGFRDSALGQARRARLYDALRHVADTLHASGELNIMINFSEADGTGSLAQAGPMFIARDGLTNGNVFERLSTGEVPFPGYAEMVLTFDWGFSWHVGTGAPPSDTLDLQSVALHEITHGLGFISLMSSDGSSRFTSIGKNTYTVLDGLLAKALPPALLLGGTVAKPVFAGTPADLTGNAVVFTGATAAYVFGVSPPIHAPNPFVQGTSLSHWVKGSLPDGSVMEPRYTYGTSRRKYADAEIGALRDIGWVNADVPDPEACMMRSVTLVQPAQNTIAGNASNQALVNFRASITLSGTGGPCAAPSGALRVEYHVDGVSRGVSSDAAGLFPLDLTLGLGTHEVRAVATRTDIAAASVEADKTFSITAAATPEPRISVSPAEAAKDFGPLEAKESADATYVVTNTGGGTLTGSASLSGDEQFQFSGASTYSLAAGKASTVRIHFSPDKAGSFSGTLRFGGNGGSVAVSLVGTGVKPGGLFNCAGGQKQCGVGWADLLVALLTVLAIAGARRRRAGL